MEGESEADVRYLLQVYLSCEPDRRGEFLAKLLASNRGVLLNLLHLPKSSEERFRVYDLLIQLAPDGGDLLSHVLEECQDDSDPLGQLAAVEFVRQHGMGDLASFVGLLERNIGNSLTAPTIAQAAVEMILAAPNASDFANVLVAVVDASLTDRGVMGVLPAIAESSMRGILLEHPGFVAWLSEWPYEPEMRAFQLHLRNLLRRPSLVLADDRLRACLGHPSIPLRIAAFHHVRVAGELGMPVSPQLVAKLRDPSMDSTIEEMRARQAALACVGGARGSAEAIAPDVMVL